MRNKKFIIVLAVIVLIATVTFIPNVTSAYSLENNPVLIGEVVAETPKSQGLTDQELIDLFQVRSTNGSSIDVMTDYINFSKPGTYQVTFAPSNAEVPFVTDAFTGFLTITDFTPEINVESETQTVMQNTQNLDYKKLFGVEAHELVTGDLTEEVLVDDSAVNLSVGGEYPVIFSVTDSQGNEFSKTVTLIVKSGKPILEGKYYTKISASDEALTDQQLIDLFRITSTEKEIKVDQSTVDYTSSDEYHISFSSTNSYGTTNFQAALIVE